MDHFVLPKDLASGLRSFSREEGVSLYVTLLAGFASVFHHYTEQSEIILGAISAGRKWPEVEAVAGDFVNPVALRIDLSGNPSFRQLVARVREVVVNAISHDEIPFQEVTRLVQPKLDPRRNPLFQIILSLQPEMPRIYPGWDLRTEEVENGGSKLDLMVVADNRQDKIFGPITYNPDLFDSSTINRLVGHWGILLSGALADPDCPISDLPLLSDAERKQIVEWNDTRQEYRSGCIHELFDAQAERSPDAPALIYEGSRFSYRELSNRANRLAHRLRSLGVVPDSLVSICGDRSPDMVAGLLGILKAGGAYLPLDPAYPAERLAFMLQDSGARILLVEAQSKNLFAEYAGRILLLEDVLGSQSGEECDKPPNQTTPENLAHVIYTVRLHGKAKRSARPSPWGREPDAVDVAGVPICGG